MEPEGEMTLTELERRLLALLANDLTVREVAAELDYSHVWVSHLLQALRETLGVRTNWGAVIEGIQMGVIRPETTRFDLHE
jgi:DNA-binding NarL/FixJ family response regulator